MFYNEFPELPNPISCEESHHKTLCGEFLIENDKTFSVMNKFDSFLLVMQHSESDMSIFDSRVEKVIEASRLYTKSVIFTPELNYAETFTGDDVDGVIFPTTSGSFLVELFTANGKYTVITSISKDELLSVLSSMSVVK